MSHDRVPTSSAQLQSILSLQQPSATLSAGTLTLHGRQRLTKLPADELRQVAPDYHQQHLGQEVPATPQCRGMVYDFKPLKPTLYGATRDAEKEARSRLAGFGG